MAEDERSDLEVHLVEEDGSFLFIMDPKPSPDVIRVIHKRVIAQFGGQVSNPDDIPAESKTYHECRIHGLGKDEVVDIGQFAVRAARILESEYYRLHPSVRNLSRGEWPPLTQADEAE